MESLRSDKSRAFFFFLNKAVGPKIEVTLRRMQLLEELQIPTTKSTEVGMLGHLC